MFKYIIKRFIASVLTVFAVITVTFFLMKFMPSNVINSDKLTVQAKANIEAKYGLDKPLAEQYRIYLNNLIYGDLGESIVYKNRTVKDTIINSFPVSAKIGIIAIMISVISGISLGILAVLKNNKLLDKITMMIVTLFTSVPNFITSAILIYILSVKLGLLAPTGFNNWESYIMPCISLALTPMAYITRLTRNNMLDELHNDYVITLQAKGLSEKEIIFKHVLKNSLIPIVTYIGQLIPNILTGSFVIEKIFGLGGLGNEFVQSVTNRDYSMIIGVTTFYCILLILFTFIADLIYAVIDPRVKLQSAE
jgi:oligopeptide transport system permease protein